MKAYNTTPFDRHRLPPRQNTFLLPLIWGGSYLLTRGTQLKIDRVNMQGLKPPYLVLGTHHAFMDFYVTPLALFPHRANYISELEGFENFGEWLYRQAGCLGTRKFVSDIALVRNIQRVLQRGDILVLYPEARYANAGTSCQIPDSVAKLVKFLDVPVVTINMQGNYLQSPIWNLKKRRGVKLHATLTQLYTREQVQSNSLETLQRGIEDALTYDEYAYQKAQNMHITAPWRAEGLEGVLYQCPACRASFQMRTKGARLWCDACGYETEMGTLGDLQAVKPNQTPMFTHIPDWYEWQRVQVIHEIQTGRYELDTTVNIEALPNAKNFIPLGKGRLVHDGSGFSLTLREHGDTQARTLHFSSAATFSVHTEYEYRGKGPCITLSTPDNTYFLYPTAPGFNVTKIQFAAEYFHACSKGRARASSRVSP